ncbi:hypothetical protein HaLaN_02560 [Haematococcus lacustris]|uniref:Uncharacterized protein n=1 Tax=Haematococcus lacustris TaxID=44745 RepID=A0A699YNM7_HAELA|nr:hypothetical protein HaLaN_02560 [Haematococcus lacustris]
MVAAAAYAPQVCRWGGKAGRMCHEQCSAGAGAGAGVSVHGLGRKGAGCSEVRPPGHLALPPYTGTSPTQAPPTQAPGLDWPSLPPQPSNSPGSEWDPEWPGLRPTCPHLPHTGTRAGPAAGQAGDCHGEGGAGGGCGGPAAVGCHYPPAPRDDDRQLGGVHGLRSGAGQGCGALPRAPPPAGLLPAACHCPPLPPTTWPPCPAHSRCKPLAAHHTTSPLPGHTLPTSLVTPCPPLAQRMRPSDLTAAGLSCGSRLLLHSSVAEQAWCGRAHHQLRVGSGVHGAAEGYWGLGGGVGGYWGIGRLVVAGGVRGGSPACIQGTGPASIGSSCPPLPASADPPAGPGGTICSPTG